MSVYSMTGYANASSAAGAAEVGTAAVNVELRSVNGRFLDISLRLPDELRSLEPALRELLGAAFKRGKIELRLSSSRDADTAWVFPMDGTNVWPRTSPDGRPAAYVTRNAGRSWQRLDQGLPTEQAWWTIKRQAMTADTQPNPALYV